MPKYACLTVCSCSPRPGTVLGFLVFWCTLPLWHLGREDRFNSTREPRVYGGREGNTGMVCRKMTTKSWSCCIVPAALQQFMTVVFAQVPLRLGTHCHCPCAGGSELHLVSNSARSLGTAVQFECEAGVGCNISLQAKACGLFLLFRKVGFRVYCKRRL